jgi:hypothetical protein
MNRGRLPGFILVALSGVSMSYVAQSRQPLHTSEQFTFVANASPADIFPLLGADGERAWAPGWEPEFLWPARPGDQAGMVFQIAHGRRTATWVNTLFDPLSGRVQYVYVVPEVVVTVITLQLHPQGAGTEVVVRYERTSLSPESDSVVRVMADHDRAAGPEWAGQINAHLSETGKH